jgi:hypothetical protein
MAYASTILATVHAPDANEKQKNSLVQKLYGILERLGLDNTNIKFNHHDMDLSKVETLVIGWGQPSKPPWTELIKTYTFLNNIQKIFVLDLYERYSANGKPLTKPRINAGKYLEQKIKQGHFRLFIDDYYLKPFTPYGMKRVPVKTSNNKHFAPRTHYVLELRDTETVEIVKLIFNMFVYDDYTRTEISNLLNAQKITPPGKRNIWDIKQIKTILKDPANIGANEFSGNIRYDVFSPIIDKATYFSAQVKILNNSNISNFLAITNVVPSSKNSKG